MRFQQYLLINWKFQAPNIGHVSSRREILTCSADHCKDAVAPGRAIRCLYQNTCKCSMKPRGLAGIHWKSALGALRAREASHRQSREIFSCFNCTWQEQDLGLSFTWQKENSNFQFHLALGEPPNLERAVLSTSLADSFYEKRRWWKFAHEGWLRGGILS